MKIFLISDNIDTLTGMRLAGINGVVVHELDELKSAICDVTEDEDVGILLIMERLAREFPDEIKELKFTGKRPLVVEIPDRHGTGRSKDFITNYIREAIGVKL